MMTLIDILSAIEVALLVLVFYFALYVIFKAAKEADECAERIMEEDQNDERSE